MMSLLIKKQERINKMPSVREKRRAMEYVTERLDGSGENLNSNESRINGKKFNYIRVGDDGIVLMVDRKFGKTDFNRLYNETRMRFERVAPLFFKDGNTFFRSAAEKNYFKKENELSLKEYTDAEMHRMMLLTPEELKVIERGGRTIQYYQPDSERLHEGIVEFNFGPVMFDYSHIPRDERFGPETRESERLKIWTLAEDLPLELRLDGNYLVPR